MLRALIVLVCLLFMAAPGCAAEREAVSATPCQPFNDSFYNPFLSVANDPWVVRGEDAYYYCYGLYVVRCETLSGLMAAKLNPDQVRRLTAGENQTEIWAPELHFYQDHWYVFYAADYNTDNRLHRMYVMRSVTADPLGEWEEPVKLELPEDQWAIDGTFFEYDDGRIFFIWSGWRTESEGSSKWKQYLYITQLETGDPTKVAGTERIMISKPQYYWEMTVLPQNEGPAVIVSPEGTYYCMYAANYSGSDEYAIAALRLTGDPLDAAAWEKLPEPVLTSRADIGVYSPGHASFVKSPDGTEDWIIYHTAKASGSGWARNGRAQRLTWVDDTPVVDDITPNDQLVALPSGEQVDRVLIQLEDGVLSGGASLVEGLTTSAAVTFADLEDSVTFYVEAQEAYDGALYIRHNGAKADNDVIILRINGGATVGTAAVISGGEDQFVVDCVLLQMREGMNTLSLSASEGIALDLVVLEKLSIIH